MPRSVSELVAGSLLTRKARGLEGMFVHLVNVQVERLLVVWNLVIFDQLLDRVRCLLGFWLGGDSFFDAFVGSARATEHESQDNDVSG